LTNYNFLENQKKEEVDNLQKSLNALNSKDESESNKQIMELTKEVKNLTDSLTESKKISTHLQEQLVLDTDNLKRKLLEEKKKF